MNAPTHALTRLFLRRFQVMASVGVFPHEKTALQPLIFNVDVDALRGVANAEEDSLDDVVDYALIREQILHVATSRHFNLLETLADNLVKILSADQRVMSLRLEIHKPKAFADAESAGIEIQYHRS